MPVPILSLYMRPDENWALNNTVTVIAGTLDATYAAEWATDGLPNRPFKATTGTATLRLASAGGTIGGVAVCHHNIDAGRTITIGGVTVAMASPAARPNGIPFNAWGLVTPAASAVTTLDLGVAGNSAPLVLGEVFAGRMREFPGGGLLISNQGGTPQRRGEGEGARSLRRYDVGEASRKWSSTVLCNPTDLDDMMAWFEAQKNGSLPSLFVPDAAVNDAWVVELLEPAWTLEPNSQDTFYVTLVMQEYPRVRW